MTLDFKNARDLGRNLLFVLAHELGHVYQAVYHPNDYVWAKHMESQGKTDVGDWSFTEAYTIRNWENRVRAQLGYPTRNLLRGGS